jgi:hypothetical protein
MENRELIERYFDRSLPKEEKEVFRARYEGDADFRGEVDLQARIFVALRAGEVERRLGEGKAVRQRRSVFGRRGMMVAICSCAAAAILAVVLPIAFRDKPAAPDEFGEVVAALPEPAPDPATIPEPDLQPVTEPATSPPASDGEIAPKPSQQPAPTPGHTPLTSQTDEAPVAASNGEQPQNQPLTVPAQSDSRIERLTAMFVDGIHFAVWLPVDERASIFVYDIDDDGTKTEVKRFTAHDYDLNKGEFPLEGIDTSHRYEFVIRRTGLPDATLPISF